MRPRINSDDCDALMPSSQDVLVELDQLPPDVRQTFIPSELPTLVDLWINFLNLTLRVETMLATVYRVRRPTVTQAMLEQQDRDIWSRKSTDAPRSMVLALTDGASTQQNIRPTGPPIKTAIVAHSSSQDVLQLGHHCTVPSIHTSQ